MRALCEMPYVHSLQMRKLAFRNEMPQKGDGCVGRPQKDLSLNPGASPPGRVLGMVGHWGLTQNED